MTQQAAQLAIEGLSRTEGADLLERLPEGAAEVRSPDPRPGELGEPATVLVLLTVSFAAIAGLCGWLAAKGRDVKWTFSVQAPGGVGGTFGLEITGGDQPEAVVERLEERGVEVPR